jgi:hypothetical protein
MLPLCGVVLDATVGRRVFPRLSARPRMVTVLVSSSMRSVVVVVVVPVVVRTARVFAQTTRGQLRSVWWKGE